jgi:hypothetical protein
MLKPRLAVTVNAESMVTVRRVSEKKGRLVWAMVVEVRNTNASSISFAFFINLNCEL